MENMCTVLMHLNAFDIFCVDISGDLRTAVNDHNLFPAVHGFSREYGAVEACADDDIIVHIDLLILTEIDSSLKHLVQVLRVRPVRIYDQSPVRCLRFNELMPVAE